jgi:hypothetical protein
MVIFTKGMTPFEKLTRLLSLPTSSGKNEKVSKIL